MELLCTKLHVVLMDMLLLDVHSIITDFGSARTIFGVIILILGVSSLSELYWNVLTYCVLEMCSPKKNNL